MTAHPQKPTVPQVLPIANALYDSPDGGAGGCWHIVLDDGNTNADSVAWCADYAREGGSGECRPKTHKYCLMLADLLPHMSRTQVSKIAGCCSWGQVKKGDPEPTMPEWRR